MSETTTVRLVAEVEADLHDKIDAYWHEKRLPSRTAAVRELLRLALSVSKLLATEA